MPAETGVDTQPIIISINVRLFTVLAPFTNPTPTTPPTIAWDVETGTPTCVNTSTVMASDSSAIKAELSYRQKLSSGYAYSLSIPSCLNSGAKPIMA